MIDPVTSGLQELGSAYRERFAAERSRKRLEQMVDFFIGTPITSISQDRETRRLGSFSTIERYIEMLQALGILR